MYVHNCNHNGIVIMLCMKAFSWFPKIVLKKYTISKGPHSLPNWLYHFTISVTDNQYKIRIGSISTGKERNYVQEVQEKTFS